MNNCEDIVEQLMDIKEKLEEYNEAIDSVTEELKCKDCAGFKCRHCRLANLKRLQISLNQLCDQ